MRRMDLFHYGRGDLTIAGEAVNGEEPVLLAAKLKPAAVVMDVHLPVQQQH